MKLKKSDVRNIYREGLNNYLVKEDERYLTEAYQTSRLLLQEGGSELDIITFHHKVLNDTLGLNSDQLNLASLYLKEWIAPFEVKIQSYRAVVEQLNEKNRALKKEIDRRKQIQNELIEKSAYFQSLIENAQDIITVLNTDGIIQFDSPSVERILGYNKGELLGENAFHFIHKDDIEEVKRVFNEVKEEGPSSVRSAEYRFHHKKGRWIYLESLATFVPESSEGSILVVNSRDITNRIRNLKNLEESRAKLAEAQRLAKVGSWEWRLNNKNRLECSDEMCRIFGLNPDNFDGTIESFVKQIPPKEYTKVKNKIETAIEEKNSFFFEFRIVQSDREKRIISVRGRVITDKDGKAIKLIGSGQDITDQKEKEKKLRDYSERLRKLSERVEQGRENERIRIAREIHDELGQMLTVLKMDVSMMNGYIEAQVSGEVLDYLETKTNKVKDRINTIIESVHRIISELRPQVLDRLGLVEAIKWQARQIEKRTNLEIVIDSDLVEINPLTDNQKTALFRIFQEAMNNVVRHAKASKVIVKLIKNDKLLMSIQDNGIGITEEQKSALSSFGIIGMYERARSLGGQMQIDTINENVDEGTRVRVRIPLKTK